MHWAKNSSNAILTPEPHSTTETIWEESGSHMLRFKTLWHIFYEIEKFIMGLLLPEGTKNPGTTKGLTWGLVRTEKEHLNAGQGWTPYMRWVHSSMRDMTYPNKSQPLESQVWANHLQESTYHMHKGYLVADGLWASICICKNSRIFFSHQNTEK